MIASFSFFLPISNFHFQHKHEKKAAKFTVQHISHYLLEPEHIRLNLFFVVISNNAFVHYAAQKLATIY